MTILFSPNQLILEITPTIKELAWDRSQQAANSFTQWQTYLNQITLNTFINYAQEEQSETLKTDSQLKLINELVNGTTIKIGQTKLVLIPSEAEDLEELRIPQEWVDIPQLVADYYLAVQVNIDDSYLRIWGYTTQQTIKTKGQYHSRDRFYTINSTEIINDINAFWVARELCPEEITQIATLPISQISDQQANNWIQRLGNSQNLLPRLSIPFTLWGSLIANNTWRDRLIAQRRGQTKISVLNWLKTEAANIISEIGWRQVEFQPATVGARGETATATPQKALAKQLTIADQNYELKIIPLEADTWGFELRSLALGGKIPAGFTLRLLTETKDTFPGNEDTATTAEESLYLEVVLDEGEGLIWEIEPTPEDYQAQILYF